MDKVRARNVGEKNVYIHNDLANAAFLERREHAPSVAPTAQTVERDERSRCP